MRNAVSQHPSLASGTGVITVAWAHVELKAAALTLPLAQEDPSDCCFTQGVQTSDSGLGKS